MFKLKFRAEEKDIFAFILVCILLLYLVCLGVVNLYDIKNAETFSFTFIPYKAFFPNYIFYTITFYIIAIVLIIASVSSYFFTREKGLGIIKGKKEDGYSRWANEKEYKNSKGVEPVHLNSKELKAAGTPILYEKNKNMVYVDNGESHTLVIGATGSGKTQRVIHQQVNMLGRAGESMIITDPKGEIYTKHGEMLREKGYKVIIVNFRDPQKGSCWNPYTLPYKYYTNGNKDKANELLNDIAINIAVDEKADDPFWTASAADFLTGLSLGLFEDAKEDQINLNSVNLMMTVGDERVPGSPATYLKEYFLSKDPSSPAAVNALGTVLAPQDTKQSVDAVLKQKIKVFAVTENLSEMLSRSDFDMENIGKEKTAIFMIIQDEKTTYHALATIFVKQCYESLIAVAQNSPKGELPIRTNFLLDEFANMPKFKDVNTMITAARSRRIRFTMIIQNFAQLIQVYGKEDAETIRGNCGNIIYLLTGELNALEEISKLCGDKIVKVGKDQKEETRPLVTISELQRLKEGEVIILKHRLPPFKTKFPGFFELDLGYGVYNKDVKPAEYITRDKQQISIFDIREFVKGQKEKKKQEILGSLENEGTEGFENPLPPFMPPFMQDRQTQPFMSRPSNSMQNEDEISIEDIIAKVNKKIEELEKEEELEKQNAAKESQPVIDAEIEEPKEEEPKVTEEKKQIEVPEENNIFEDDYFDDFFEE
ncbi:MAG TPA: type IV secretory system conjugative DNA transfer family protein [Bacilli bacterium]|nr:type IV secretory system conjugative DNA transfer family protein [Bacilli bacterium]